MLANKYRPFHWPTPGYNHVSEYIDAAFGVTIANEVDMRLPQSL